MNCLHPCQYHLSQPQGNYIEIQINTEIRTRKLKSVVAVHVGVTCQPGRGGGPWGQPGLHFGTEEMAQQLRVCTRGVLGRHPIANLLFDLLPTIWDRCSMEILDTGSWEIKEHMIAGLGTLACKTLGFRPKRGTETRKLMRKQVPGAVLPEVCCSAYKHCWETGTRCLPFPWFYVGMVYISCAYSSIWKTVCVQSHERRLLWGKLRQINHWLSLQLSSGITSAWQ